MKSTTRYCLILLAGFVVLSAPRNAAAQTESFFCDGALAFNALFTPNGESVLIEFEGRVKVVLNQAKSRSGKRYTGGGYVLYDKNGEWTMTRPGRSTVDCALATKPKSADTAPPVTSPVTAPPVTPTEATEPRTPTEATSAEAPHSDQSAGQATDQAAGQTTEQIKFPHPAYSFGGKVRSRPDMRSRRVAGLDKGDEITLLENTGERMGQYDWFKVRFRGRTGYHWGGLICTDDFKAEGVLSICPQFGGATQTQTPSASTGTNCKKGQYWSRSRKKCRWYADEKKQPNRCPSGTVWSEEGNFCRDKKAEYCGPGYHWNKRQRRCQRNH